MKEYFPHEFATRMDQQIKKMIRKHGALGYGVYWMILEDLYSNDNKLEKNYEDLGKDYGVNPEKVQSIVENFGLFEFSESEISSNGVQERIEKRNSISASASERANKRWGNGATALQQHTGKYATALPQHLVSNAIKEKEIKEDNKKENKENEKNTHTFFDMKEVEIELLNSPAWIQSVCMTLKTSEDKIIPLIKEYCLEQTAKAKPGSILREYKDHFVNWARIRLRSTGIIRSDKVYTYKEYCDMCSSGTYTGKDFERTGKGQWILRQ